MPPGPGSLSRLALRHAVAVEQRSDVQRRAIGKAMQIAALTSFQRARRKRRANRAPAAKLPKESLGLELQSLTPDIADHVGVDEHSKGAVVAQVKEGSPAAEAGVRLWSCHRREQRGQLMRLAAGAVATVARRRAQRAHARHSRRHRAALRYQMRALEAYPSRRRADRVMRLARVGSPPQRLEAPARPASRAPRVGSFRCRSNESSRALGLNGSIIGSRLILHTARLLIGRIRLDSNHGRD